MTLHCLACDGSLGEVFFSLSNLPLVDSFCRTPQQARSIPRHTVDLRQCDSCSTIQISFPPDTSEIYRSYIYESASSPDLSDHFSRYADYVASLASNVNTKILEIGVNDGLLLQKLADIGFTDMLGVDPSPQTAQINIQGVSIINDFFTESVANEIKPQNFDIIIANNCFSHIPNLSNVLARCASLLRPNGSILVEVQSCLNLLEGAGFDYIYHEHYFYHTAHSFEKLAIMSGLSLYHIDHMPTKGGSYRLLLGHPGAHAIDNSLDYWKFREKLAGVHCIEAWNQMEKYLEKVRSRLLRVIDGSHRRLVGYGASATSTVFMNYMGIEDSVEIIVDDNLKRQGLYAPGSAIPIMPPSILKTTDMCLILAWRHVRHILPHIKSQSIPYINPLPIFSVNE